MKVLREKLLSTLMTHIEVHERVIEDMYNLNWMREEDRYNALDAELALMFKTKVFERELREFLTKKGDRDL